MTNHSPAGIQLMATDIGELRRVFELNGIPSHLVVSPQVFYKTCDLEMATRLLEYVLP